ncbi:restriction endonuclease subunit S [Trichlorobacter lovleyi]|uniref:restriction endonuclease subunit S n=1 Tax=Trichlorobacter lovleyi TaxID=313985 RepID=UPI00248106C7|nr:restriction endonuclease subunit S [Trichlorobacter lovleyi]
MKAGWEIKTLDQIAENLDSKRIPITKSDRKSGEYPYYGASGIVDYVADYIFDYDTLLISEDGANLLARSTPIAFPASGKYWVNNHAHILKFDNMTNQRFVELYLESIPLDEYITGAAQPKLNQKALNSIPIPFPPLPEQQRIVGILDEAFEGIATAKANTEKNLQNARALFESHLQAVFSQRGERWVEKRLDDLCVIGDGNHSSNYPKKEELVAEGVPFIRATNFLEGRISGIDMRFLSPEKHAQLRKGHLKTGDVLFTNRGEIGKTAIVDSKYNNANLNSQIAWFRCGEKIDNRFLYHFLNSSGMKAHFQIEQNGAALQQFTIRQIKELIIPVPSKDEQLLLVKKFDDLSDATKRLESIYQQKLAALDALKKSLLDQAFSGKL